MSYTPNDVFPEFEAPRIDAGAYDAAVQETVREEQRLNQLWLELSRNNPQLALSILKNAQLAAESHQSPDKLYVNSSLIILEALSKQLSGKHFDLLLEEQVDTQLSEVVVLQQENSATKNKKRFSVFHRRKVAA